MRFLIYSFLSLIICQLAFAQDINEKQVNDRMRLLGVWVSNCYNPAQFSRHGQNIFVKDTYTFGASGSYTLETSHFSDAQCTQTAGNAENFFGEYALGDAAENADAKNLRRINLTLDNADWPEQFPTATLQWVIGFNKNRLFFGAFNPPTNSLMRGLWFEKVIVPNNGVFVF